MAPDVHEIYAIRYATRNGRRTDHFIGGDPHDAPMPMDYFIWVAIGPHGPIIIDTGFTKEVSSKRKRDYLRCPIESLSLLGIDSDKVETCILTHLHYDHVGSFHKLPSAMFHIQEKEMSYATGRFMRFPKLSHAFEVEDVCGIVRMNFAHRVVFHQGRAEITSGLEVIPAGGHSAGLQFVKVFTKRGWVILASDVTHFYENIKTNRPFSTAFHVGEMLEGFELLRSEADGDMNRIIPGHDPKVMELYPPYSNSTKGVIVRLDAEPRQISN